MGFYRLGVIIETSSVFGGIHWIDQSESEKIYIYKIKKIKKIDRLKLIRKYKRVKKKKG